ncbi:DUF4160 domain-containing protein [Geomonas paludis]|uniref:DUF4160 domain-containing protein n=1 Tax=Geomonas paludis TaxID=2740185 RepID=UPI00160AC0E4
MTRLHHNRNWKIEVFGREHGIPHFHLRWPEGRASISIDTLEVLVGIPPRDILLEARAWARVNRARIWDEWQKLNQG